MEHNAHTTPADTLPAFCTHDTLGQSLTCSTCDALVNAPRHGDHSTIDGIISCEHPECVALLAGPRLMLTGKIGPAFGDGRASHVELTIVDTDSDSVFVSRVANFPRGERRAALAAAFAAMGA